MNLWSPTPKDEDALKFGGTLPWEYKGTPYEKEFNLDSITTEFVRCIDPTDSEIIVKVTRIKILTFSNGNAFYLIIFYISELDLDILNFPCFILYIWILILSHISTLSDHHPGNLTISSLWYFAEGPFILNLLHKKKDFW